MKLTRSQLENLIQNTRLDHKGENLYGTCPFCGHDEFGISLVKEHNPFNCFRKKECGESGWVYKILKHLGRGREFIGERQVDIFGKLESVFETQEQDDDMELPEISIPILWRRLYEDKYLRERGFQDYQFNKFEVGRSKLNFDYVTFLVRMNSRLVGYVSRSEKSKEWIDRFNERKKKEGSDQIYLRYNNSITDFTKVLFGYDEIVKNITTDVILVEGIFSKTKTDWNLGLDFDGDKLKCCSTFGAKISKYQIGLLKQKGITTVHVWFEADVLEKIKKVIGELANHFIVKVGYLSDKDPGDLVQEEAIKVFEEEVDWVDFFVNHC